MPGLRAPSACLTFPAILRGDESRAGAWLSATAPASRLYNGGTVGGGQGSPGPHVGSDLDFVLFQVHGHKGVKFQNWAKTYGCCPEMYYQPTSVEEIREVSVHPSSGSEPGRWTAGSIPSLWTRLPQRRGRWSSGLRPRTAGQAIAP